jgi:Domain of unknown function (DUF5666)
MPTTPTFRRLVPACAGAAALLLALTACGGSSSGATGASGQASGQASAQPSIGAGQQGVRPGASGKIAAVSGKTLQVQSQQDGQVAVTYTGSTTFTRQVSAALSDVKVGDCVMASAAMTSGAPASSTGSLAATTVRITQAVNGSCAGGPGGFRGQRPSGAPSGGPGQRGPGGFGGGAFGTVTAVSGSGFTVKQASFNGGSATSRTVTVSSSTTYSTTEKATSSAVKVGLCASAQGQKDSTGAVTAQRISLSNPVSGQCSAGLGGRFGGGSGGGAGTGQAA